MANRRTVKSSVIGVLKEYDELPLDTLGPRVRIDYTPDGEHGQEWLRGLLSDLEADGLVETKEIDDETVAQLCR